MTYERLIEIIDDFNVPPEEVAELLAHARDGIRFGETLEGITDALGQKRTHYLVMADDVATLREGLSNIFNLCLTKRREKKPYDHEVFQLAADALETIRKD